jgi:3-deoxy-7-phosphoheptulonate synthase
VHKNGQVAIVETRGNKDCHVILRGGKAPNYDAAHVAAPAARSRRPSSICTLMVDCSPRQQQQAARAQLEWRGTSPVSWRKAAAASFGVMVESH